jgi:hypothetical protein
MLTSEDRSGGSRPTAGFALQRAAARRTAFSLATLAALWGPLPASGGICVVLPRRKKVSEVRGQVVSTSRAPIEGAEVHLRFPGRSGEALASAVTDHDGRFAFGRIPPGTYRIRARHGTALSIEAELTVASWPTGVTRELVFEIGSLKPGDEGSVRIVERR